MTTAPAVDAPLTAFLEIVPDAMIGVDGDSTIRVVNSHAACLFGYERASLIGRSLQLLLR